MTIQDQINSIKEEMKNLYNQGEYSKVNEKRKELDKLEAQMEAKNLANANVNALKDTDKVAVTLESVFVNLAEPLVEDVKNMNNEELLLSNTYREGYLKRLQGKNLSDMENTAVSGQSTIPTQTMNKIVEKLEQTAILFDKITVTNFPNKLSIPVESATADASWIAMANDSTDSADSFDAISLTAHKLIKTIEIDADVQTMSIDVFESFIVSSLSKKMSKAIENSIINGTGTNQPTGLGKSGEITEEITFTKAGMKYKDLMTIIASLPTPYHTDAIMTMPRELFYSDILGMTDTNGNPVVVADKQAKAKFNVLGYEVRINDYMPADTIIFGDMSYFHMNFAKAIEISSDKSVGFRSGSTVYRALALADGKKTLDEAFVKVTRALT